MFKWLLQKTVNPSRVSVRVGNLHIVQMSNTFYKWVFSRGVELWRQETKESLKAPTNTASRAVCGMSPGGSCPERIADVYYCGEKNDSACFHKQQA